MAWVHRQVRRSAPHESRARVSARMDANSEIFKRILDDKDFRDLLGDYYVRKVYDRLREAA